MIRFFGRLLFEVEWVWDGWEFLQPSDRVFGYNKAKLVWWVGYVDSPDHIRAYTLVAGPLNLKAAWVTP